MSTLSALYSEREDCANPLAMQQQQNLRRGFAAYPPHSSSTDSDSIDSLPGGGASASVSARNVFGDHTATADRNEFFVVGDLDLQEQLDPWRRNVPSPMPRVTDAITQGMFH
jgi:hypothetical protein